MASRKRFNVPSLQEMEKMDTEINSQALFNAHHSMPSTSTESTAATTVVNALTFLPASTARNKTSLQCGTPDSASSSSSKEPNLDTRLKEDKIGPYSNMSTAMARSAHNVKGNNSTLVMSETSSSLTKDVPKVTWDKKDTQSDVAPRSSAHCPVTPPRPGKLMSITVNGRQRGNPILKFVRSVPWEFGDIVPDYQLGQTTCALFLSLRYHQLHPGYIHDRLRQLGHSYNLRILLVQVDVQDPHHALKDLAKICILADCTLILAFSVEEAGRYLETYKAFENKPPDLIQEKTENNFLAKVTDTLTSIKKVNKTDTTILLDSFGTVANIVNASEEDLSLCSGFGPQKARRLHSVMHEPFLKKLK